MGVFVSYSSRDRDAVNAEEHVWLDQRLGGGDAGGVPADYEPKARGIRGLEPNGLGAERFRNGRGSPALHDRGDLQQRLGHLPGLGHRQMRVDIDVLVGDVQTDLARRTTSQMLRLAGAMDFGVPTSTWRRQHRPSAVWRAVIAGTSSGA
jgi:hypothetical protein